MRFKPYQLTQEQFDNLAIAEGQFIINLEDRKIYIDVDGDRINVGGSDDNEVEIKVDEESITFNVDDELKVKKDNRSIILDKSYGYLKASPIPDRYLSNRTTSMALPGDADGYLPISSDAELVPYNTFSSDKWYQNGELFIGSVNNKPPMLYCVEYMTKASTPESLISASMPIYAYPYYPGGICAVAYQDTVNYGLGAFVKDDDNNLYMRIKYVTGNNNKGHSLTDTEWWKPIGSGGGGGTGAAGESAYIWLKYAPSLPTANNQITDAPNINTEYIGIYSGNSSTAPENYSDYTWLKVKGEDGESGDDGFTPVITVTSKTDNTGVDISVTNKDSSPTNFEILNGVKGEDGFSPTASIEEKLDGTGAVITITDKNGTTTADINHGHVDINADCVILYATFNADSWSSETPFTQTVNVLSISEDNVPVVDISLSDDSSLWEDELAAYSCLTKLVTNNGSVTAYCLTKPENDFTIQMKIAGDVNGNNIVSRSEFEQLQALVQSINILLENRLNGV